VVDSAENVLSFRRPPYSAKNPGAAALDLVYQAAELIEDANDYAVKTQTRAEALAKQAIEKLKIGDVRVRSAESGRQAAEAELKEFSDRLEKVEKLMDRADARMAAAEAQLSAAQERTRTAEMRANEAENALSRIEEALCNRILKKNTG